MWGRSRWILLTLMWAGESKSMMTLNVPGVLLAGDNICA